MVTAPIPADSLTGRVSAILKHPYTQQLSSHAGPLERELTQTNRFYPLPSELKQDDFLTTLFTPRNGIKELCDYLIELIKKHFNHFIGKKENTMISSINYIENRSFKAIPKSTVSTV